MYNSGKTARGPKLGTVYVLVPPAAGQTTWTKRLIYAFPGYPEDGAVPFARLTAGKGGVFYGTTLEGGIANDGTVFRLTPPAAGKTGWTETVLYSFRGGSDGAAPRAGVVMDPSGNLYGTTLAGGDPQCPYCGVVFMLSPPPAGQTAWTETVIHRFTGGASDGDNRHPYQQGELLFDAKNNALFGATYAGGLNGLGVVFELTPPTRHHTWNETIIYDFSGGNDGANPNGGLIGGAGALFGTTQSGGNPACPSGCGTVFLLQQQIAGRPLYTLRPLHGFFGNTSDGAAPMAGLFKDAHNVLWGTTSEGGGSTFCGDVGCGTVFKLIPDRLRPLVWHYSVQYRFLGAADGGTPLSPLVSDANGALYGTTAGDGGPFPRTGYGTVFQVTP
jgi:uncharacterized repeat protein (TIGR03803 family)